MAAAAKSPDAATSRREGEKVNYISGSQLQTEVKKRFVPFIISSTRESWNCCRKVSH